MALSSRKIVGMSQKTLKVLVKTTDSGEVKSTGSIKLNANAVIRQIAVTAEAHNINREITVFGGGSTYIDHLPDLQSYETAPLTDPDTGLLLRQAAEIDATVRVPAGAAPAADTYYLIAVDYWIVLPEA